MFSMQNQPATLKNVNVRKELHGDQKVLSVDLKLAMQIGPSILERFDPSLEDFLYVKGQVRFPLMGPITWDNEIEHTQLNVSGIEIKDAKLRKFSLTPQLDPAGQKQLDLILTASYYPSDNNLSRLGELVQEEVTLDIDTQELV